MRAWLVMLVILAIPPSARAQVRDRVHINRLNGRLAGRVVDYTHNEGRDLRLYSPILGMPRDLYVYLPPGYDPRTAYPLIVYLHMSFVDEHTLVGSRRLVELDRMIARGEVPPVVLASPDGTVEGENRIRAAHSLFINGCGGRFEDHLMQEVVPFLMQSYSIRPEREAHALLGASAGGLGAMDLALKRRDFFGAVATLGAPLNLRYATCSGDYFDDFDPATYRWNTTYDAETIVGAFYFGLKRIRARTYIDPIFGCEPDIAAAITRENPADLLAATDLRPGQLAIYVNYPGRDSWNFDAQDESFLWLAARRGIAIDCERIPCATHSLRYFIHNHVRAFRWLGRHLLPPVAKGPAGRGPMGTDAVELDPNRRRG